MEFITVMGILPYRMNHLPEPIYALIFQKVCKYLRNYSSHVIRIRIFRICVRKNCRSKSEEARAVSVAVQNLKTPVYFRLSKKSHIKVGQQSKPVFLRFSELDKIKNLNFSLKFSNQCGISSCGLHNCASMVARVVLKKEPSTAIFRQQLRQIFPLM